MLKKFKTVHLDILPEEHELKQDEIYFSDKLQRSTHLCPCDCGEEVYLPHYRGGWSYYIDETNQINISTKITNKCGTHYTIHSGYAFSKV